MRRLGDIEVEALPDIIINCLDLGGVEIHNKPWTPLTPRNVTVVRGHKIFYPGDPGPIDHVGHLAHMVHEMVHIWQYLYLGVGLYSPRWIDRRYRYALTPEKRFKSYGLEQQASMFEDFFRRGNGLPYRWAMGDPTLEDLMATLRTCSEDYGPRQTS